MPLLDLGDLQNVALVGVQLARHGRLRPFMHPVKELGPLLVRSKGFPPCLLQLRCRINDLVCLLETLSEGVREHCLERDRALRVSRGHVTGEEKFLTLPEGASANLIIGHVMSLHGLFGLLLLLGLGLTGLNDRDKAFSMARLI